MPPGAKFIEKKLVTTYASSIASRFSFRGPTSNLYKTEVGWPSTVSSLTSSRLTILGCAEWRAERDTWRDLEAHHQDPQWLIGIVGDRMLHARSHVGEIIRAQGMGVITVLQSACALQNEIDFFLTIVENVLAIAVGVKRNFAEARNASQIRLSASPSPKIGL